LKSDQHVEFPGGCLSCLGESVGTWCEWVLM